MGLHVTTRTAEPPTPRSDLGVSFCLIQVVKPTSHSSSSWPGAQVGEPHGPGITQPQDEALVTAHGQGMPQHLSDICRHTMGVAQQMKQLQTALSENLASALDMQTEPTMKRDPAEDRTKNQHRGASSSVMDNFQTYLTSQEDSAWPIQALYAASLVSCR